MCLNIRSVLILIKMLQVHNILLQMCNLSNILQTAKIIVKNLATVYKRFVELQRIWLSSTLS